MTPLSLGIFASANLSAAATSFESIATVTVGSGSSSSITFTSIPNTFSHLQLRAIARTDRSGENETTMTIRFNSDTGNNYSYHRLIGDGSSASADAGSSSPFIYFYAGASATSASANTFGVSVWDILDYNSTVKNKTVRYLAGMDTNGAGRVTLQGGAWYNNTTAISSITIATDGSHNFTQYTQFALYGCKSA